MVLSSLHDFLLYFLQKQKQMEILKIEQEFQEMHQREVEIQEANKLNRLKVKYFFMTA